MDIEAIKQLRKSTGAGMMDAKSALEEAGGDQAKAIEILRRKGLAKAAKKAERETKAGVVASYVHMDRVGVLVEVNCETDFVARTDEFKALVRDLTLQVAGANPQYVAPTDIPQEVIEHEKDIYSQELKGQKKSADVIEKVVEGKLDKFYSEVCLLKQPFIKEPEKTVEQHISEVVARLGENITVGRFMRMEAGQS